MFACRGEGGLCIAFVLGGGRLFSRFWTFYFFFRTGYYWFAEVKDCKEWWIQVPRSLFRQVFFFLHKLPFGASSALLQLGGFCTFFVYDCCFLLRVILSCGVLRQKTFKTFRVQTLTWCSHPRTSFLVGRTPGPQNGGMVLLLLTPKPPSLWAILRYAAHFS